MGKSGDLACKFLLLESEIFLLMLLRLLLSVTGGGLKCGWKTENLILVAAESTVSRKNYRFSQQDWQLSEFYLGNKVLKLKMAGLCLDGLATAIYVPTGDFALCVSRMWE